MKKLFMFGIMAAVALAALAPAKAETPYTTKLDTRTTNEYRVTRDYASEKPLIIEAYQASAATGTITIARIREDRTNTMGSITLSGSAGVWRQTNAIPVWLFRGDRLRFIYSGGATSSVNDITGDLSSPNQ
ncbi:MAG TPA: hypothetical protein PKC67_02550 [Kiritimatiellia bacterium]|nr:hypothetical protein [Kiritimatiellia bacterium]HMP33206.1 hypothetical protein [Kiritimatiellia bacterium]